MVISWDLMLFYGDSMGINPINEVLWWFHGIELNFMVFFLCDFCLKELMIMAFSGGLMEVVVQLGFLHGDIVFFLMLIKWSLLGFFFLWWI